MNFIIGLVVGVLVTPILLFIIGIFYNDDMDYICPEGYGDEDHPKFIGRRDDKDE